MWDHFPRLNPAIATSLQSCKFTRFPKAIPLRNIKASKIVPSLVKFFTFVGLPVSIQSDQGSNFMSGLMQQVMHVLGVQQYKSSAYHPESQGAIERFHQTLKNMIRAYCFEYQNEWDQGISFCSKGNPPRFSWV